MNDTKNLDLLSLSEAQAVALTELLPRIKRESGLFHGLHFWMRDDGEGVLVVASDSWPGTWRIEHDGSVEEPEE